MRRERDPNAERTPATRWRRRASEPVPSEVERLFAVVQERYGNRLTPEQLEAVRTAVAAIVEGAKALRAVRLDNADGPILPLPGDVPPAP